MSGGRCVRRDVLLTLWQRAGISTSGQRAYHLLWNLGQRKHLVFGPPEGKHPTFALFQEWVKAPRVTYYVAEGLEPAGPGVYALPGFDEYLLGYQDRSPVLPAEFAGRITPGNNGMFLPTIVADGQVVGTWKRTDAAKVSRIERIEFTKFSKTSRTRFERALTRYGQFVGRAVTV